MKKFTLFLVSVFCLTMIGCGNQDAEIDSFLAEWNALSKGMEQKIDDGDLNGARTDFDTKKESLKAKLTAIQSGWWSKKFSDETRTKFDEDFRRNQARMINVYWKHMKLITDKVKAQKLRDLIHEYGQVFGTFRIS